MSKVWKGWMSREGVRRQANPASIHLSPGLVFTEPAVICPIDDESLPHPGDGREWITKGGTSVEILSAPAEGVVIVKGEGIWGGSPCGYDVDSLRERKPEPEHEAWCRKGQCLAAGDHDEDQCFTKCSCERRSGEDRRQGERREQWPYYTALADRRFDYGGDLARAKRGGRSGEDRRSP